MATKQASKIGPLLWIGPTILLIVTVVLFPAGYMIWTSTREISVVGSDLGAAGFDNFRRLLGFNDLPRILINTVIWVVGVVVISVLVSLALAQLLHQAFPGRRLVRLAVIVPWASSVVMTSLVVLYGLDPFYGIINEFLVDVGILDEPFSFTRQATPAFIVSMGVAVFVSLPFTTYTILAGLQGISDDMLEAAEIDGAGRWREYFQIILPNLRPALAVATIINIINVFNSLPILRTITGSISGNNADTTTTFTFKLKDQDLLGAASALSVVNFLVVLLVILAYLRFARPMREV